ncbi:type III secretion system inner membrane ring lipoprotein SctJ [Shewanella surugensis]|uniref:Lipoprotein n=1 Tax=Shewanella surugensis TaxID=212020 RepID=A0ABT0L7K1_9GAMM|nr:type III secretion inner membrane ring lipoprotein SctJ [Shewanella surugensis]MCL1123676.1 type III secretion inner membrane ring lipoprotein SctJ [Shewanella surugensis]
MKYIKLSFLLVLLFISGCKMDLYRGLPQDEANQMLALLMLNNIDADAEVEQKTGTITLSIDKDKFINAVELLRQNGFPKDHYTSIEDLFPSGQLVTSPAQEKAKMNYFKEQQLERTLSSMKGVISARVSIADTVVENNSLEPIVKSASAYIKYSPEANLNNVESQIKSLIKNSVPQLEFANISLLLQAADYQYKPQEVVPEADHSSQDFVSEYRFAILGVLGFFLLLVFGRMWQVRRS